MSFGPLTPLELARAEDARQAAGTAAVTAEAEPLGCGMMTWEHPGSWANQAVGLGDAPLTEAELDRLVAFFHDRGAPAVVELTAFAAASVVEGVARRGFTLQEVAHVLAVRTDAVVPTAEAPGVSLSIVDRADPAEVSAFVQAGLAAFAGDDAPPDPREVALMTRITAHPSVESLLARAEGEVAGTGQMSPSMPLAGLFAAGVLPMFRRRGIHQTLLSARVARARASGCTVAVVESAPGGSTERNARRLGFELAYAKVKLAKPLG